MYRDPTRTLKAESATFEMDEPIKDGLVAQNEQKNAC